jgi:hypothetical protein
MWSPKSPDLLVRVQALAMAAGTVTVAALGHVPVAVAVGWLAVLAEVGLRPTRPRLRQQPYRPQLPAISRHQRPDLLG